MEMTSRTSFRHLMCENFYDLQILYMRHAFVHSKYVLALFDVFISCLKTIEKGTIQSTFLPTSPISNFFQTDADAINGQ